MSDDIASLSPVQMDALREIGNVGAGNSATALSQIINRRIDMDVPRVSIVPLEEVPELVGGPDTMVVGVFLRVYGKAPCCQGIAPSIWWICLWAKSMATPRSWTLWMNQP